MNRLIKRAACLLIVTCLGPTGVKADVQETVEQYRSGDERVTVESFSPAANGRFPAVFLLHGSGGLEQATGDVFREIARGLAEQGYVVLIPHVFEKTGHNVGAPFRDDDIPSFVKAVEDAIEFAATSDVVDPDRIGLVGYSMGAYLAFLRSPRDPRIKAIVSCSGPLPVESKSKFPPVLILQGSKDKSSPPQRLKAFQEKMKTDETPCAIHIYRGMAHNFDVPAWDDASGRIAVFFNKHLKRREAKKPKASVKRRNTKTTE